MKKILIVCAMGLATTATLAQELGRVLSATPVVQQVAVPRQVCSQDAVPVTSYNSGAGAAIGAIAGGVMGNAIGHGSGRAAATVIGLVGGAIVGDRVEGTPQTQYQTVQNCSTQTFYESRAVSYNVVYEYAGKQYAVQMQDDPGPSLQLQVTPVGSGQQYQSPIQAPTQAIMQAPARIVSSTTYIQPAGDQVTILPAPPVYYQQPYYQQPYYGGSYVAPVAIGLGLGFIGGYYGGGRGFYQGGGRGFYHGGGGFHRR